MEAITRTGESQKMAETFPAKLIDSGMACGRGKTLPKLSHIIGDKYRQATTRCLKALGESGMGVEMDTEQTPDPAFGIRLHAAFNEHVVEELKSIKL